MPDDPALTDALFELDGPDLGYEPQGPTYAANTLRGYRFDLAQLSAWAAATGRDALPATPGTMVAYLEHMCETGARMSTMARLMSSVAYAHRGDGLVDPTRHPDVSAAWTAVRRSHGDEPDHAVPLLPPMLFDVVGACPTTKTWSGRRRPPEPSLGGLRDRALLLVGFVAALRRSELVGLHVDDIEPHPRGLRLLVDGPGPGPVVIRGRQPSRCPVRALERWLSASGIEHGPVFRGVTKANRAAGRALHAESVNALVQRAVERAGYDPSGYSAHSLRAGFVTYSQLLGIPEEQIAAQSRHRSMPAVRVYARRLRAQDAAKDEDTSR